MDLQIGGLDVINKKYEENFIFNCNGFLPCIM